MLSALIMASFLLLQAASQTPATPQTTIPPPGPAGAHGASVAAYVPQRVYDTQKKAFVDFEVMLANVKAADVLLVGEQHDDPNTHRLEAAVLDGLVRRGVSPVVSLEMFERDAQPALDAYFAGRIGEDEALKDSRPWPRYRTDYRALVERAKAHGWPLIAANVPRRLAQEIAKGGKAVIDGLSTADRAFMAADLQCPLDRYFTRFTESMGDHPGKGSPEEQRAAMERYYLSQCVKDETMAEAIAGAVQRRNGLVVHYNGAFHSDFRQGTAERVVRRLPGKRVMVMSILPVEDLDQLAPEGEDLQRADYLVYTTKPVSAGAPASRQ